MAFKTPSSWLSLVICAFAFSNVAHADWTATDLGDIGQSATLGGPNGGSFMGQGKVTGVNGAGQLIGQATFVDTSGMHITAYTDAFLYSNGQLRDIGRNFIPVALNDAGQVVGSNTADTPHALMYSNGTLQDLNAAFGGDSSQAFGINNNGQVVGVGGPRLFGNTTPILYANGVVTNMGPFRISGIYSAAYGINNVGHVVGQTGVQYCSVTHTDGSCNSDEQRVRNSSFTYSGANGYTTLSLGESSHAQAINDHDQVVGTYYLNGNWRGYLDQDGQVTDLSTLFGIDDSLLFYSVNINNAGQILAGVGISGSSQRTFFLYDHGQTTNLSSWVTAALGHSSDSAFSIPSMFIADGHIAGNYLLNTPDAYPVGSFMLTETAAVAEPPAFLLMLSGFTGLAIWRRRSVRVQSRPS